MAYQSLKEILNINMKLEKKFKKYLDRLVPFVDTEPARIALQTLRDRMDNDLDSVNEIERRDFGSVEFVKEVPDTKIEEDFPRFQEKEKCDPLEFLAKVLQFEKKHLDFYVQLKDKVAYSKSKDICDMLIRFKLGQIKGIEQIVENHNLAI